MFDFLAETKRVFSNDSRYYETGAEANADFSCKASQLPPIHILETYISSFRYCDDVTLSFRGCTDFNYNTLTGGEWNAEYERFLNDSEPEDDVAVNIHINKRFDDRSSLSVYCMDAFVRYYANLPLRDLLKTLANNLAEHKHLSFYILDQEVNLATDSLCFYSDTSLLTNGNGDREHHMAQLNDASLFLNRNEIPLTPYDFRINQNVLNCDNLLTCIIKRLELVFSYLYLAYCGQIIENQVVLQLAPSSNNFTLTYEEMQPCQDVCDLFYWTFDSEYAVERSGIVRNLLAIHCKSAEALLLTPDAILMEAKSNYILFQKKSVDKYIELKNAIATSIVGATESMQGILQGLADAVRNNFVAVIVFLITIILTDSVNWEDIIEGEVINPDLLMILHMFCISSFFYLVVTIFGVAVKWRIYCRSYHSIKANYADVLDQEDLENAFDNDAAKKSLGKTILIASSVTATVWLLFILVLLLLLY